LRSLESGLIVSVVLTALVSVVEVLAALVSVCEEAFQAVPAVLLGTEVKVDDRRWSWDLDLDFKSSNLGRTEDRKKCVSFSHTKLANMPAKKPAQAPAHTRCQKRLSIYLPTATPSS